MVNLVDNYKYESRPIPTSRFPSIEVQVER